jgi:hypothetical protein
MPKVAKTPNQPVKAIVPSESEVAKARAVMAALKASRPAPSRYGNTVVAINPAPTGEDNLPKQARVILTALRAFKKPISVNELVASLPNAGLETRQEPYRIYTFYRARLIGEGRIKCS